ncbi:MAG: EAL domain-containing protein [Actinobacteria bacterium]|nr:EAL domain-containing protein [Actinomycetota bacterium]
MTPDTGNLGGLAAHAPGSDLGPEGVTTLLRAAMDTMLDPMVMMEPVRNDLGEISDFIVVDGNEAFFRFVGQDRDQYLGTALLTTVPGQAESGLLQAYAQAFDSGEPLRAIEVPYADEVVGGQLRLYDLHGTRAVDRLVLTFRDVTDRVSERERLEYLAFHDPTTGLPNVAWARNELDRQLRIAHAGSQRVAVFLLGLDNFKLVNDSLGHVTGDELLATVGARLADQLPDDLACARLASDEFIVLGRIGASDDVAGRVNLIQAAVSQETYVSGHAMLPSATIGVALSNPESDPSSLLREADSALSRAKATSKGSWQPFDTEMLSDSVRRLTVEADLRTSLGTGDFLVYYQPIVRLADRSIVGHEALVRWLHPIRGLLGPAEFLPVAEESGLVLGIGRLVLDRVCSDVAAGRLDGTVSVNVSAVELTSPRWCEEFQATLGGYGVSPDRISVEVTETAVLGALDSVRADLERLRALGVGVYLDDFGTGYSSIALLRDLPVTGLKLDRRFVGDLADEVEGGFAHALADGVATLMTGLGLEGIAEGIETPEQSDALTAQGWTLGQGYLFGRPAPLPAPRPE